MRFIDAEKAAFPITMLCRLVDGSRAGYDAWSHRHPSQRDQAAAALTAELRPIHTKSRQTYGVPRGPATRRANGRRVSRKRVARLLRAAGSRGCGPRRRGRTTISAPAATPAPNLVPRQFAVAAPTRLWITDLT